MLANCHIHTWRCGHAKGTEREYVDNGLNAGLQVLGFSDHAPYVYPNGYRSHIRMGVEELDDYVRTVLNLRREYGAQIEIPLGLNIVDRIAFRKI